MKAIRQAGPGGKLKIEELPVPLPGPGEVLIRMSHSPVNPSDLAVLKGGYMDRPYPFTPGLEGSGLVVAAGKGILPAMRLGKRVACSPQERGDGCWAEYMLTSAINAAPLPEDLPMDQGSMMLVNPMTVMAFFILAEEGGHSAIINNAAASSLGKMMVRMAKKEGIPLVSIVRKSEQAESLRKLGAEHVLISSEEGFEAGLEALASELDATLILDAVTGPGTATLLKAAPPLSTLVAYARLSGEDIVCDPGELIREDKEIIGFQLGNWLKSKNILFKLRFLGKVKKHMGTELFADIAGSYELDKAAEAIEAYKANMSAGKVLLDIAGN